MNTTHTNGSNVNTKLPGSEPGSSPGSEGLAAIDDALVARIVQQILSALPAAPTSGAPAPLDAAGTIPPGGTWLEFARALDGMLASSQELRDVLRQTVAKSARQTLAGSDAAVPSLHEFEAMLDSFSLKSKGGTVVRAFWWGFHIEISHEDLQAFLAGANSVNAIVDVIGGSIPSPAQPFIKLAAAFIAAGLGLLGSLDRGRGVYVSMSWFAIGVFVPTSV